MRMPFRRTGTATSRAAVVKQLRLFRSADQMPRERPGLDAAVLVKLAKMRYRLLNDPPANPNAAHQSSNSDEPSHPSAASCSANTCAKSNLTRRRQKIPSVVTTRQIRSSQPPNLLIHQCRRDKSTHQFDPKLRKLG